jgi:hypothetical protein
MEHESLDYKIVMEDGSDTEVLGRLASLDIASAAYLRAIVQCPRRNVRLCQGEQIIKRHDGEPKPPKDPNLKRRRELATKRQNYYCVCSTATADCLFKLRSGKTGRAPSTDLAGPPTARKGRVGGRVQEF